MLFSKDNDLLIIPDVHGRTFWREAVNTLQYAHIVFLGDYTDPYPSEGISQEDAYDNFADIIEFAIDHRIGHLVGRVEAGIPTRADVVTADMGFLVDVGNLYSDCELDAFLINIIEKFWD